MIVKKSMKMSKLSDKDEFGRVKKLLKLRAPKKCLAGLIVKSIKEIMEKELTESVIRKGIPISKVIIEEFNKPNQPGNVKIVKKRNDLMLNYFDENIVNFKDVNKVLILLYFIDGFKEYSRFNGLTDETMRMAILNMRHRVYADGERILNQGDLNFNFYVIIRGKVSVRILDKDKIRQTKRYKFYESEEEVHPIFEKEVTKLKTGSCFGEWSLLNNTTAATSCYAEDSCVLLILDKQHFLSSIARCYIKSETEKKSFLNSNLFIHFEDKTSNPSFMFYKKLVPALYKKGDLIYEENTSKGEIFIVYRGQLLLKRYFSTTTDNGDITNQQNLLYYGRGSFIGTEILLEDDSGDFLKYHSSLTVVSQEAMIFKMCMDILDEKKREYFIFSLQTYAEQQLKIINEIIESKRKVIEQIPVKYSGTDIAVKKKFNENFKFNNKLRQESKEKKKIEAFVDTYLKVEKEPKNNFKPSDITCCKLLPLPLQESQILNKEEDKIDEKGKTTKKKLTRAKSAVLDRIVNYNIENAVDTSQHQQGNYFARKSSVYDLSFFSKGRNKQQSESSQLKGSKNVETQRSSFNKNSSKIGFRRQSSASSVKAKPIFGVISRQDKPTLPDSKTQGFSTVKLKPTTPSPLMLIPKIRVPGTVGSSEKQVKFKESTNMLVPPNSQKVATRRSSQGSSPRRLSELNTFLLNDSSIISKKKQRNFYDPKEAEKFYIKNDVANSLKNWEGSTRSNSGMRSSMEYDSGNFCIPLVQNYLK